MGEMGRTLRWYSLTILLIHAIAIGIFVKGFLLTRRELPFYSQCSDLSHHCFPSHSTSNNTCWTKPAVDRVLIIVLDALRFDFAAPSSFFTEKKRWMDKLTTLHKATLSGEYSAKIFKAIADPPTTSLQRLKGLTTGGLPTFIDVGNSFGAPAIIEDNIIDQLVRNGKRVLMMGDDTWLQLFPNHFHRSYPYPSFNVKDLHTVDNGCIDHLFPSLYEDDWDVLIAHFLGVDHAGHIFGVDSVPMLEKLEHYNLMLEKVIEVLKNESRPGGLHQNTLLLVMGDHGQTLNGDHGGGSPEEVETSIFAMSFNRPPLAVPSKFDTSSCELDQDAEKICVSSIQQLDFAVTLSALLGVPFPFGSIGHVNPELYALAAGTWNMDDNKFGDEKRQTKLEEWIENYAHVLCINSWQVKKYIDVYSASSIIGFSSEDLSDISDLYARADENWSHVKDLLSHKNESWDSLVPALTRQIDSYLDFLLDVVELARSKWTEFNMKLMGVGLGIMIASLFYIYTAIRGVIKAMVVPTSGDTGFSFTLLFAILVVVVRACSFLSNSYILEEGKVAIFLLATTGITKLRRAIMKKRMLPEACIFLLVNFILRFAIEVGLSKQAATSLFMNASATWMLGITPGHQLWTCVTEVGPVLALLLLAWLLYKFVARSLYWGSWECVILGTVFSYVLVAVYWMSESSFPIKAVLVLPRDIGTSYLPRITYAIGLGQLLLVASGKLFGKEKSLNCDTTLVVKTLAMLSAWSSTIIILSGKQGSWAALACVIGGYCLIRLGSIEKDDVETFGNWISDFLSVTQWNLLAVCLFFATGHWCAFDGLRYGAAFIGFDEFILVRQAILLAIDTFGFSHILPILGLPLLVSHKKFLDQTNQGKKRSLFAHLSQIYMVYGLITSIAVTVTLVCVTIHRRHLMVWGLFAPKFVFDVVALILTDVLVFVASLLYSSDLEDDTQQNTGK